MQKTKFNHLGSGLGNYRGDALTTGCSNLQGCFGFETEILNMTNMTWSRVDDYPKENDRGYISYE